MTHGEKATKRNTNIVDVTEIIANSSMKKINTVLVLFTGK